MSNAMRNESSESEFDQNFDWKRIVKTLLTSRLLDQIEETELLPQKKIFYQFTARGHDFGQIVLGTLLDQPHDAVSAYYRSRPMLLTLGLPIDDGFAGPLGRSGGFSDGRDIGVVCNLPGKNKPIVLPMAGDVGSQYTPVAGWAQAIRYRANVLGEKDYAKSIGVTLGGDASVATNGFWSALTIATTLKLPMLFYIEDNGYGISVPSTTQTPGANIAENLASFKNLKVLDGDGTCPLEAPTLIRQAVEHARSGQGPVLLRLTVPRLAGHSGQDTQTYKTPEFIESEKARDPLPKLKAQLASMISDAEWTKMEQEVEKEVRAKLEAALARPMPNPENIKKHVYFEPGEVQQVGGLYAEGYKFPAASSEPTPEPTRTTMAAAIRRTLESELASNKKFLIFGEDIGPKGGVHAVTMGLQETFGDQRVFDTSLSEEGIVGRAVGMALCGLMPMAEIQFRKYMDPATEQLNNCGTTRWRTNNRFAAPIVVRTPVGFFRCGDPWHSQCGEAFWAHAYGWQVAFPSNAEDAVGLLRAALRDNNPTIFFEHRALLDQAWARRPYPGDNYVLPFGKAKITKEGTEMTCVTWGAMVERAELAAEQLGASVEVIDLRTVMPWDKAAVLASVAKTRRVLVLHEDALTAGMGAEIAAVIASESFFNLDAPVERLAVEDIPIPYEPALMNATVPSVEKIAAKMKYVLEC